MSARRVIAVLGATGFVGRAAAEAIERRGGTVVPISTPRFAPVAAGQVRDVLAAKHAEIADLAARFTGCDTVVVAAGRADAGSSDEAALMAANALVPAVAASAAQVEGSKRFVHVSSAATQGRIRVLDETPDVRPFSPYSRSKALGEQLVREIAAPTGVIYRPPGVHGSDRALTQSLARVARSPMASVARPGTAPTPQALLANVADAIAFLATCELQPPTVVMHPSEGLTTTELLYLLGGRRPHQLPPRIASAIVVGLDLLGHAVPALAADARRAEMLWFGQGQGPSWLTRVGWQAPVGRSGWASLGRELAAAAGPALPGTQRDRT